MIDARLKVKVFALFGYATVLDKKWRLVDKQDPLDCRSGQLMALQQLPDEWELPPAPSLASNGEDQIMAVWIQDEDPDPLGTAPQVYYSRWDGAGWSPGAPVTTGPRFKSDPRVAFLAPNRALAVWTQNEWSTGAAPVDLNAILARQEIYAALWDGTIWGTPMRLTEDATGDGLAAVAADPTTGTALVAWVHDGDGRLETRGDWEIHFARGDGTAWRTPQPIAPDPNAADLSVALAFDSGGRAMAVWVRDHDADFATNTDRRLVYSLWDGQSWGPVVEPAAWPTGTLMPSLAFDRHDRPVIVFTVRGTDPSGQPIGIGTYDVVWSARQRADGTWDVAPVGRDVRGEWPQIAVNADNQALIAFRQFGDAGTPHYTGEVASATADLDASALAWSPPAFITDDALPDWQVALAVDPRTRMTHIFNVKAQTPPLTPPRIGEEKGGPAVASAQVTAFREQNSLQAINLPHGSDLVLHPADVVVSNEHPLAGETVVITATVRNLGLQPITQTVTVRFYEGPPITATLIGEVNVPGPLAFNEARTVSVQWVALGGVQDLSIVVDANNVIDELTEGNNAVARPIGLVPAPTGLLVASNAAGTAVLLTWTPPATRGIAGYRVYRAAGTDDDYTLIGLTASPVFEDRSVVRGAQYRYAVSAYDVYGVESAVSEPASAPSAPVVLYLPLVMKQAQ